VYLVHFFSFLRSKVIPENKKIIFLGLYFCENISKNHVNSAILEQQRNRPAPALRGRRGRAEGGAAECAQTVAQRHGGQLGRHGAPLAARLQGRAQGRP